MHETLGRIVEAPMAMTPSDSATPSLQRAIYDAVSNPRRLIPVESRE
jgi:hypothetical protein